MQFLSSRTKHPIIFLLFRKDNYIRIFVKCLSEKYFVKPRGPAWDVMSGVTKTAWDILSGVANLCGMFGPGCQKMDWDVLSRDVLSGSPILLIIWNLKSKKKNMSEQYDNPADMSLQMHKHSHSLQSKQIARKNANKLSSLQMRKQSHSLQSKQIARKNANKLSSLQMHKHSHSLHIKQIARKNAIKLSPLQMRKHSHSLQSKQIARKNTNKLSSLQMRKQSHSLQSKQIARNNANKVSSLQMRKQSHSPFRANTLLERMPINCLHYKYANNPTPFSTHVQILTYTFNIFWT